MIEVPIKSTLPMFRSVNPYEPGEVAKALSRPYEIATWNWTTGLTTNTELGTPLDFPGGLLLKTFIREKIKWYKYYKFDIELTFKFRSNAFDYGLAYINALPFYLPNSLNNWRSKTIQSMYQSECYELSIAKGLPLVIPIGWVNPYDWLETNTATPMGYVTGRVVFPLKSTLDGGASDKPITVFARFKDMEITGLAPDVEPAVVASITALKDQIRREMIKQNYLLEEANAEPHMEKEAEQKSSKGLISGVVEAASSIAPLVGLVAPEFAPVAALAQTMGPAISSIFKTMGLDKPTTAAVAQPIMFDALYDITYGRGLDPARKLSMDPMCSVSTAKNLCGTGNPLPTVAGMCRRGGLIQIGTMTNASDPLVFKHPINPVQGTLMTANPTYNVYQAIPAELYARKCGRWRGGMKWCVTFEIPKSISFRVHIAHVLETYSSTFAQVSGDLYSKIHDVSGPMKIKWRTPWIAPEQWANIMSLSEVKWGTPGSYPCGFVQMTRVSGISSTDPTADPQVNFTLAQACAEDFQLQQLLGQHDSDLWKEDVVFPPAFPTEHDVKAEMKKRMLRKERMTSNARPHALADDFNEGFDGLSPASYTAEAGMNEGEDIMGPIQNWIHRYCNPYWIYPASNIVASWFPQRALDSVNDHFMSCISAFMFARGAVRVLLMNRSDYLGAHMEASTAMGEASKEVWDEMVAGSVMCQLTAKPVFRFELPFYLERKFQEIFPTLIVTAASKPNIGIYYATGLDTYYAAGDDFSLGMPVAAPLVMYKIIPTADPSKATHRALFSTLDVPGFKDQVKLQEAREVVRALTISNSSSAKGKEKNKS